MKHDIKSNLRNEEYWNVVTHGIAAVGGLIALIYMFNLASATNNEYAPMAVAAFGLSIITTYTASTVYHLFTYLKGNRSLKLRIFDHITIYYLIAGSYTPFALIVMPPESGWFLFKLAWFLAILGTLYKLIFFGTSELLSICLYVVMGWLILLDYSAIANNVTSETFTFLKLGGAAYMIGVIFYANEKIYFNHVIWHLFVMLGSGFHVAAVVNMF